MTAPIKSESSIKIRRLGPADAAVVAALEAELHDPQLCDGADNIREYLQNAEAEQSNFSCGLFHDGELVGYVLSLEYVSSHFREFAGERVIYLEDIAVAREFRRHLFKLVSTLLELVRQHSLGVSIEAHTLDPLLAAGQRHGNTFSSQGYRLTHFEKTGEQFKGVDRNRLRWTALDTPAERNHRDVRLFDRLPGSTWLSADCNYSVRLLENEDDWQDVEAYWDEILFWTSGHGAFQTYNYQRLWWKHFSAQNELFICLLFDGERLTGIAPLQIVPVTILGLNLKQLTFIGTRWEVDRPVLMFPEAHASCAAALVRYLMSRADRWDVANFHEQVKGPESTALMRAFAQSGCLLGVLQDSLCPYIDFAEEKNWQTFIAGKSQKFRKNIKAARNKLEKAGELQYHVYTEWQDIEQQLERYRELESRSWKTAEGVDIAKTPEYYSFHKDLARVFSAEGQYVMRMLTLDSKPVAGTFGLVVDGVFWSLHIVHDEKWSSASPGTYLEYLEIQDCFEQGLHEYEFLGGFLNNKKRWARNFRQSTELRVYRKSGVLPLIYLAYFVAKPWVRASQRLLRKSLAAVSALALSRSGTARWAPLLPLKDYVQGQPSAQTAIDQHFPFSAERIRYTFSATAGIFQAVNALGIQEGRTVLVPSYSCGHEVEPLLRAEYSVAAYRVDQSMMIDLDDLSARIDDSVAAVLVTHYFGFPQKLAKLRELCDSHGIYLIEDCAHALFSQDRDGLVGRAGDVAVYSQRKTYPIPNGGALVLNNPSLEFYGELEPPPKQSAWYRMLDLMKKSLLDGMSGYPRIVELLLVPLIYALLFGAKCLRKLNLPSQLAWFNPDEEEFGFDDEVLYWQMSPQSAHILHQQNPNDTITKRRENFSYLLHKLRGNPHCRPVFNELPLGVCPLYFPLIVYNRSLLQDQLRAQKVTAYPWWEDFHYAIHWKDFPDAVFLKDHVIALPIHQDINRQHLDAAIAVLADVRL